MVNFFFTKYMAKDDSSGPLNTLIPKIPFAFFCRMLGPGHLWGPVVSLGRIFGSRQLSLFGGGI